MSFTKRGRNLPDALRLAYPGPKAAERLAVDLDMSLRSARSALSGQYPRAWERFLRLIEKCPRILADALQTTWAEELTMRRECNEIRSRISDLEKRLNANNSEVGGKAAGDGGERAAVGGRTDRAVK